MNNEQVIPNESKSDTPTFKVLSDGKEVDAKFQFQAITVNREINRIATAKLLIRDGEASEGEFSFSNMAEFEPGKEIEIKAGFDADDDPVFKGLVVKHSIKVQENGNSQLSIVCKDQAVKMTVGRKNGYFTDSKDSDVIGEILSANGVKGKVDATKVTHTEIVQHYMTDWDFVLSRAEANGLVALTNDGKVDIIAPDAGQKPVLNLTYGGTLIEFDAELDARYQWKSVTAKAWDYGSQKLFESSASSTPFKDHGNLGGDKLADVLGLSTYELQHSGFMPEDELQSWADAELLKSRLAKIRGSAKFKGLSKLKLGDTVELGGVGDRFNGVAYVTAVVLELVKGNLYTHVQFGADPRWFYKKADVLDAPSAGLMSAVYGLMTGVVVKIDGDPEGQERIQVKCPIIDADAKGVWARLTSLDAGSDRGWVYRPEVDDEVIVGFINGDPRDAVIIGMVHSGKNKAPIPAESANDLKGYTSRSKMKFTFDDGGKVITIETPGGNSVTISDADKMIELKDQNMNSITMNQQGIQIKTLKDVVIDAKGSIEGKATVGIKLQALKIDLKAVALKLIGAASAKLSAAGKMAIKGKPITLN
ncbi:MAG: type VI secretion system tip protein VgrG [Bacteroidota bacterium]